MAFAYVTQHEASLMAGPAAGRGLQSSLENLSEDDLDRLEAFRRSKLAKASTRKVCMQACWELALSRMAGN